MNLTDTHCHLDLDRFDADRPDVIRRAEAVGVSRILIPSLTLDSSRAAVKLAASHPMLYTAIGIHPTDSLTWDNVTPAALSELAASPKVVAIGEIGLDYYWDAAPHEHQRRVLKEQLALAAELELPVVIHLREAEDAPDGECASDLIKLLGEWVAGLRSRNDPLAERPGVLHSFSGSLETAREAIRLGFYIGITGPVTYKNAEEKRNIVRQLPLTRLLIETDSPFLAPVPQRGKRNEPAFVRLVAGKIAELHSKTEAQVAETTTANAARLFSW
ncbi:MAG: TatD family hydrolase [Chloroflexota bacterium]